jgi:protoporphyrinogen/coproporphyrinogen III oxidase
MSIIVVGGGLTGLAAAWELQRLGVSYTLIEVKDRLGGSIITQRSSGFVIDGGAFLVEKYGKWAFLDALGLRDVLISTGRYRDGELVYFRDGTQTLVDALTAQLHHPQMLRMAVSSIGAEPGGYGVCLENGVLLEAAGVIIAAPARYAERMLRTLLPEAALYLAAYQYEPVVRVSLGYRAQEVLQPPERPAGDLFRFVEGCAFPSRVPTGCVLLRAGVRLNADPDVTTLEGAVAAVRALMPNVQPVVEWATYWGEDFALTGALPEHTVAMREIEAAMPRGLALVGSDYRAKRLDDRIEQGRAAARAVVEAIG